jgi:carboxylate-amine ligase
MPGSLEDVTALAALIQCLVVALDREIEEGTYQHDCHPMLVRQNLWRAARFGLDAELVDAFTHEQAPARTLARGLAMRLREHAKAIGCVSELDSIESLVSQPTWAERQLAILDQTGDPAEVVRRMVSRCAPAGAIAKS